MTDGEALREARLTVIGGVKSALLRDTEGLAVLLNGSPDLRGAARCAIDLAATLLRLHPEEEQVAILDGLLAATLGPDGCRP